VAVLGLVGSFVARTSQARLHLARERLLAGRAMEASRVLEGVRWPPHASRARVARALAASLGSAGVEGAGPGEPPPLAELEALAPEAVLVAALERGEVDAAARAATLLRRAGHPLGALYAAAFAFDRGDEAEARREAAASPAPLAARGPGQRLVSALAARDRGARTLLWDRGGRLVQTIDDDGSPRLTPEGAGTLDEALGRLADGADTLPREASSVRLTLDADLSRVALDALGPYRGSVVLLDPRTGALLAAVTDAATAAAEPGAAFAQRREPASIAKVLTVAAAYRAGHDADGAIGRMACGGVERYGGKPLWCAFRAGPLEGLDHALGVSCNVAFANVAMLVGRERLVEEYRLWGFDGGALLGAAGRIHGGVRGPRELADLGIGLEQVDVTPLHAAALAAVIGDDGRMPAVHLVAGATSPLALRDAPRRRPPGREVVPPAIAARLRAAMASVARRGTGVGLAPAGFPMAMKTGTAATPGLGYHVNYIGTAPLPEPTVAFAVRVTGERSSPAVTEAAREVTRRLLASLAARSPRLAADARRQRSLAGQAGSLGLDEVRRQR
jgi:peptidoglycan glycosyltransferase